ncbi:MAG: hypothetical protein IPK50_03230 [Fibrobacterota bacterium]|nr:hypothetical protein [Fibrobacterota bacterium]QQS05909.1 MAG: hypothetical protein IPK50_03230 [Fibrobacterota bacterium]
MDLLRFAATLFIVILSGCTDPFAPSEPEPPSSEAGQFASSVQQLPDRIGDVFKAKNPSLLASLIGDPVILAAPPQPEMDQVGFLLCVQRITSAEPGSQLRWWSSSPTSTTSTSSDTVVISLDYRLERVSADLLKIDTLAIQQGSLWTVLRANPAEWRLLRWSDPSAGSSLRQVCGSSR